MLKELAIKKICKENKEELEVIKNKKENYEKKNMGKYRKIFPWSDQERQDKFLEFLKTSSWTIPFQGAKINNNNSQSAQKSTSIKDEKNKKINIPSNVSDKSQIKIKKAVTKPNKSPYDNGMRRLITPASQKQKNRGSESSIKNG